MPNDTSLGPQPLDAVRLTAAELLQAVVAGQSVRLADGSDFIISEVRQQQALEFFVPGNPGQGLLIRPLERGDAKVAEAIIAWLDTPFNPPAVKFREKDGAGPVWRVPPDVRGGSGRSPTFS